ncbi:hypothetical protein [Streptomyces caniscabiei]|uniref:Uncharacterized protein n=1 Tax=Streptomyces caniscabiei TaxID=2746961 RepID=A0A927QP96_9ACTN|nr:hypothetical protein [Streptomyces caniscabiei]MBD9727499.1 hypothetical protein [Streptomyces caniscabiei]MDX3512611.1 hypothetical protein [Streptomyces caniscabiei]MDX3722136.1 hypothetical protein [Streptomyces caniscabiei]MDX3730671.1 hypothetical protein [Streptomyces caniscabiei]WEO30316.1 hypothetical protein IHE65_40080 [Streptomyces caniscabiei]
MNAPAEQALFGPLVVGVDGSEPSLRAADRLPGRRRTAPGARRLTDASEARRVVRDVGLQSARRALVPGR